MLNLPRLMVFLEQASKHRLEKMDFSFGDLSHLETNFFSTESRQDYRLERRSGRVS
ncbi:MAG TPA: hypothetical protein VGU72_25475 [Beijerinckiaceae bacterium]|jgi:hypothetical protein|nr:hypothetical protein [Beijerinckiaceae bacterium]